MQSYLVRFLEDEMRNHNSDSIDRVCIYLKNEVIPFTGNYFDELVEIAKICRPMYAYAWHYKPFVERLKEKILEERGEEDGQLLIRKFT